MNARQIIDWISGSRGTLMAATLVYAYAIHYAHVVYLHNDWEYYGFTLRALDGPEMALLAILLVAGIMLLPAVLTRPSSIVMLLLFVVVYVPAVVITLSLDAHRIEEYGPSLVMLGLGFAIANVGARTLQAPHTPEGEDGLPGGRFTLVVLLAWAAACAVLVYSYAGVMRFVGLADIYEQRAAGQNTSALMGYTQTYFSNVLSPALIAIGLMRSRWLLVALGTAGCIIMFMIAAQRTVILLPLAMIALYFALTRQSLLLRSSSFLLLFLAAAVLVSVANQPDNVIASVSSLYLVFRTVGLPGLTFSQYHDLFGSDGFTWWSHVKGLSLIIPPPSSYVDDASWPNLGFIVGDRVYASHEMNANANLFSGDGVAAAGAVGVAVIGIVLALWLALLDRVSRGWNRNFAILVLLPVALSLTNGHFFTTLLSFGGLFWMAVFYFYKPYGRPGA